MLITYWIVAGLLALAYLGAGGMKLASSKEQLAGKGMAWVEDFPAGAVKAIGAAEVLGALGLVLPPLTGIATVLALSAAVGLVLVQVGAAITHLRRGEAKVLPANLLLLVLAGVAAWTGFVLWT